jgi:cysteine desulfurase
MSRTRTYLDWNATAPLRREARAAMVAALDVTGNPSSPHAEGRRARAIMEDAREQVAAFVRAKPAEVVFTSGGTEANNAVLAGGWNTILLSGIEHDSVLAPARVSPAGLIEITVGTDGVVSRSSLAEQIGRKREGRTLLSLQMANNETGALQPVVEAARQAKAHGLAVHSDAVQAAGRLAIDMAALGVDYLTLSAHKLGGPKGIGALIVREGASLPSLIVGGGQERRRRAGTENVAAIAGFGAAAEAAGCDLD